MAVSTKRKRNLRGNFPRFMKTPTAVLAILFAVAIVSAFAAQSKLADNRQVIVLSPVIYDSPFFPPDPSCGSGTGTDDNCMPCAPGVNCSSGS